MLSNVFLCLMYNDRQMSQRYDPIHPCIDLAAAVQLVLLPTHIRLPPLLIKQHVPDTIESDPYDTGFEKC